MPRVAVCLALSLLACSRAAGPPSATARRVSLVLDLTEEEHSKDSHTRHTTYRLEGGVLSASRAWSGYHPGKPPEPSTTRAAIDDAELGRLIERMRKAGLERAASSDVGQLGGPGTIVTADLELTLDGQSSHSRSVRREAWNDQPSDPPPLHAALLELAAELSQLDQRDR